MTGHPLTVAEHHFLADRVRDKVHTILATVHDHVHDGPGNGAPFIQGAITAVLEYGAVGGLTDEALRKAVIDTIDEMLPQIRMAQASRGKVKSHT
ncbi:hypothetical protein [Caulobacter sp.]|uniref:hypothetical protein n=1 Tax=Caulobacter sp. TaxID=78 RepID=UPI003BB10A60